MNEIRPAIALSTIFGFFKKKYNLDIEMPLETRAEFADAFIWCNNENFRNVGWNIYKANSNNINSFGNIFLVPGTPKYKLTSQNVTSSFKITNTGTITGFRSFCIVRIYSEIFLSSNDTDTKGRIRILRKGTNDVIFKSEVTSSGGIIDVSFNLEDAKFISGAFEFIVETAFDDYMRFKRFRVECNMGYFNTTLGYYSDRSFYDNQVTNYNNMQVDLMQCLPSTPVIELLNSIINSFNIQIFDSSPNNDNLYFLTPTDINSVGQPYSKRTLDYTPFVDKKTFSKKAVNEFNYYNLKHKDGNYRSNVDYKTATGLAYAQLVYLPTPPSAAVEYKIETNFVIIPPVKMINEPTIVTAYGFNASNPTITNDGFQMFEPNYNELTIFYKNDSQVLTNNIALISNTALGAGLVGQLTRYIPTLPFKTSLQSLGFSILVLDNVQYTDTLYQRYYDGQINRLLDANCLAQSYDLKLPLNEIYLNETETPPKGFRLQNDIIIGEDLFTILDTSIDITSGKAQITLLNY